MCNENNTPSQTENKNAPAPVELDPATVPGFDTTGGFIALQRITNLFNRSSLVPTQYQGPKNFSNTAIALEMALRMKANPLLVFQNLYIVQGRPAWSSQFLIATFNRSGRFSSLRYEFEGKEGTDDWGCRAVATELSTGQTLKGTLVTIGTAKKEGWFGKGGSKWQTIPEQMLRYRSAAWFIRAYAPEIAMGLYSEDELHDALPPETSTATLSPSSATAEDLNAALASTPPAAEPQKAAPRRGRPPKNPTPAAAPGVVISKTETTTAAPQEEIAEAEIVDAPAPMEPTAPGASEQTPPAEEPQRPQAQERPAQTQADRFRESFVAKCRRAGVNPSSVRNAACDAFPSIPLERIHEMLVRDDEAFAHCANVGESVF